jgi:hypothetical protein
MKSNASLIVFGKCEKPVGNLRLQLDLTPRHSVYDISETRAKQSELELSCTPRKRMGADYNR